MRDTTLKPNIHYYQNRRGEICIRNGSSATPLTREQILALNLDIYGLDDFDFDDYKAAYAEKAREAVPVS